MFVVGLLYLESNSLQISENYSLILTNYTKYRKRERMKGKKEELQADIHQVYNQTLQLTVLRTSEDGGRDWRRTLLSRVNQLLLQEAWIDLD